MPTIPNWDLGYASEESNWYILPKNKMNTELIKFAETELSFAKAMKQELDILNKQSQTLKENLELEVNKRKKLPRIQNYVNEYRSDLSLITARRIKLSQYNWESRVEALQSQLNNNLNQRQLVHNDIRNCELTCLTCKERNGKCYEYGGFGREVLPQDYTPKLRGVPRQ